MSKRVLTKAERKSLLTRRWGMKQRCYNESGLAYKNYGGRGIRVCDEWLNRRTGLNSFVDWAMASGFEQDLQIDRIDNDGGYGPDNCRWVTAKVNSRNKGNHIRVTAFGETKLLIEWVEDPRCVVRCELLRQRIYKHSYSPENAITSPFKPYSERSSIVATRVHEFFGEMMSAEQIINDPRCIVSASTLRDRVEEWDCTAQECATTPLREIDSKSKFYLAWGESKTLCGWVKDERCGGTSTKTIRHRIWKGTMTNEEAISTPNLKPGRKRKTGAS